MKYDFLFNKYHIKGIVVVILFTILVALMNDTYTKVSQHADTEWKYSKSFMYAKFLSNRAAMPPPFTWVYYLAYFVRWCKMHAVNNVEMNRMCQKKKKYFDLLRKLVSMKLQLDKEDSCEDEFDDLRQDFRNSIKRVEKFNTRVEKRIENVEKTLAILMRMNK